MRVIEPKNTTVKAKFKNKHSFLYALLIVLAVAGVSLVAVFLNSKRLEAPAESNIVNQQNFGFDKNKPQKFKQFSPDEFRDLYNSFAHPNTERINEETPISGDSEADERIRELAEERGYKLRSAPVSNAFAVVSDPAAEAWKKLSSSAKKDNINLRITEALRSAEDQKAIFLSRLGNISLSSISEGRADSVVIKVLEKTAPPGYSRHHSGYTIDLACDNQPSIKFEDSVCFDWLNENNYQNAKQNGWIPSYPEGTKMQGPEPESWEYVWVGVDALLE
jgi:LAS superfamily LD-carboxypeptidase LdcB